MLFLSLLFASIALLSNFLPLFAWLPKYHLIKHQNQFYCDDEPCITNIIRSPKYSNKLFIVWYTSDVEDSPYLVIYFEYIWTLLNKLNCLHIILDIKRNEHDVVQTMLYRFPNNTIYIAIADAKASLNVCLLSYIRMDAGYVPPVLIHLNHENPW